jgi:hypothetical protein
MVRVTPPDSYLDINITALGDALEVLVSPRGRQVQVRVGPGPDSSGSPGGGKGLTNGSQAAPAPEGPIFPPAGDSALAVEAFDLQIDEKALESLSDSTKTQGDDKLFDSLNIRPPENSSIPGESSEPPAMVYRDRDGSQAPLEVKKSLAQLADPEPIAPADDPKADTARSLEIIQIREVQSSPEEPAALNEELSSPEEPAALSEDEAWSADLGLPEGEFSLDDESPLATEDSKATQTLAAQEEPDILDKLEEFSLEDDPSPEDTNFDEPNINRPNLVPSPKPGKLPPDASTAVIVNYLEDTEDSFFEDQGQATILPEEEDMDIDLLELGAGQAILPAKPMTPVPRKAV